MALSTFTYLCSHYHHLLQNVIFPNRTSVPIKHRLARPWHTSFSLLSMNLTSLGTACKWDQTVFILLLLLGSCVWEGLSLHTRRNLNVGRGGFLTLSEKEFSSRTDECR